MNLFVTLALALLLACSARPEVAGRYEAAVRQGETTVRVILTLAPDGTGKWAVGTEEAVFSWMVEGERLRLFTRQGGVVEGRLEAGRVRLHLPGWGPLDLRR